MRLVKWELNKLARTPALWVYLALCLVFNALILLSDNYPQEVNELSREIRLTGETRMVDGEDIFDGYDATGLANGIVDALNLRGMPETLMRGKYQELQPVVEGFAEKDVSLDIYAGLFTKRMHGKLFGTTFNLIVTESVLLAVLTALYILGYEHLHKTELLIYSSRTGRDITRHKRIAGMICAVAGFVLIACFTLGLYFTLWDYSGLWGANVSSQFNYVLDGITSKPFITWRSFTVAEYLVAVLCLHFGLTLVFTIIGNVLGLLTRNTYMAFMGFILMAAVMMAAAYFFADIGFIWGYFLATFSPMTVWAVKSLWLTDMGVWGMIPYHETAVILGNLILASLVMAMAARRFKRKDMV